MKKCFIFGENDEQNVVIMVTRTFKQKGGSDTSSYPVARQT